MAESHPRPNLFTLSQQQQRDAHGHFGCLQLLFSLGLQIKSVEISSQEARRQRRVFQTEFARQEVVHWQFEWRVHSRKSLFACFATLPGGKPASRSE